MGWSVMIFAAGFGTRMKHLTKDRPKPMVAVSGRPLIDHAIACAEDLPAKKIVANLHYKANVLETHLVGSSVQTVLETPDILDTGGGLRNALPLLGPGPVMTLNPDAIWSGANPLQQLAAAWQPDRMDGLLMSVPLRQTHGYKGAGNFVIGPGGRVARGDGVVYGGAQIIKTDRLAQIPQAAFSLNVLWDMMIAENSLYAIEYGAEWCDVGHPGGISLAEDLLERRDV